MLVCMNDDGSPAAGGGAGVFDDPAYYKTVMGGGSEQARRLHAVYRKYVEAKDNKDKAVFKQQMVNIYWDYCSVVAGGTAGGLSGPKKYFLRFAMLNPNALAPESREIFARVPDGVYDDQSVYYLDEWFDRIGRGELKNSSTDEGGAKSKKGSAHARAVYEKAKGQLEGAQGFIKTVSGRRDELEERFRRCAAGITERTPCPDVEGTDEAYTAEQKNMISEAQELLKQMLVNNRELGKQIDTCNEYRRVVGEAKSKLDDEAAAEAAAVDLSAISEEFEPVRQMAKMTIGRQGNSFPFLSAEYFHSMPGNIGFKENVIKKLDWVESIDRLVFDRTYRTSSGRIIPNILLLPTYGDFGICWEPFERLNKISGKGRIAIPMYPRNLSIAVLTAIGDFRWQMAKENASFYWMDEGLTGNYYQWHRSQKLKGDLKQFFIKDYILWMTKEADGIQKLDKTVREIFWRYMPFSQELKDTLGMRAPVYQELCRKDKNRAMSDGY